MHLENAQPTRKRIKLSGFVEIDPSEEIETLQEVNLTIKGQFEDYNKKIIKGGEDILAIYKFAPDKTKVELNGRDLQILIDKEKQNEQGVSNSEFEPVL